VDDNLRQKASGIIYSTFLVTGLYNYRYTPKHRRQVDDYPSCNFLVRKSVFEELGGFDTVFWPGEDTKLCLDITKRLGKRIIYDPKVLVYHHRRPLFLPHLRQVANYALHRGYFVKRYPQTSLRLSYFVPSIFVGGVILGLCFSLISPFLRVIYLFLLATYLLSVFLFSLSKNLKLVSLVFSGIILTHLVYGLFFIKGLLSKKLREEFGE
jgi:GT2 family glycosyltransferase